MTVLFSFYSEAWGNHGNFTLNFTAIGQPCNCTMKLPSSSEGFWELAKTILKTKVILGKFSAPFWSWESQNVNLFTIAMSFNKWWNRSIIISEIAGELSVLLLVVLFHWLHSLKIIYIYLCLVFHLLCVFIYIARRFFRAISNGIDGPGEIHLPLCSFAFIRKSSLLVAIASFWWCCFTSTTTIL